MSDGAAARAQRVGLGVVLLLGCIDLWRFISYQANPDGVSYIDLALAFAAHGPAALVNGYWSPLLPALIGTAFTVHPPTIDSMYPIAHLVGFLPFVMATLLFHRLLSASRHYLRSAVDAPGRTQAMIVVIAWSAYVLYIVKGIGIQLVTPDIGVAATVFWLASESFSLGASSWPVRRWVLAGAVLGAGYWWKAILFPTGMVWYAAATLIAWRRRDELRGPAAGAATYAMLALVLAVPVSRQTGRLTFGETGRLNYLWYVNSAPYVWERCLPANIGSAMDAPFGRIARDSLIAAEPATCLVSSPAPEATLPLWDDPSRYYRDAHTRRDVPRQVRAIRNNLSYLEAEVALLGPVLFVSAALLGLAALATLAVRGRPPSGRPFPASAAIPLATLVLAPIAFYLLVYVEFRHIAPSVTVAIALVPWMMLAAWPERATPVIGAMVITAVIDVVWRVSTQTLIALTLARATLAGRAPERIPDTQIVARALRARGLAPDTHVVSINDAWNAEWAQLTRLRIRAHVPEYTTPIAGVLAALRDACTRSAWDAALRAHGITAAVAHIPVGMLAPPDFERLAGTEFFLHAVAATPGAASAGCASRPAHPPHLLETGERQHQADPPRRSGQGRDPR